MDGAAPNPPSTRRDAHDVRLAKPAPKAPDAPRGAKGRLSIVEILDKLDAADDGKFRNRRAGDRVRFRRLKVAVKVMHPGGSTSERSVATRNISTSGIGFLYDSFLHIGTRVIVHIPRRLGGEDALAGKVVYCAHVNGAFHQVGLLFDKKIFAKLYCGDPEPSTPATSIPPATAGLDRLSGRLLVIEAEPMDRALVAHHLRDTKLDIVAVADVEAALVAIRVAKSSFAAVLCALDLETPTDVESIAALRTAGHAGVIVAAGSSKFGNDDHQRLASIGISAAVLKPYSRGDLIDALARSFAASVGVAAPDVTGIAIGAVERGVAEVRKLVDVCRSVK